MFDYHTIGSRQELRDLKTEVDWFNYPGRGDIIASAANRSEINIGVAASHDFQCLYMTGAYTTISEDADIGTCPISMRLTDEGSNTILIDQFVNLALLFSPGRVRTSGIAGDPSHQLFYPMPFEHLFQATSNIKFEFISNATTNVNQVFVNLIGRKWYKQPIQLED